VHPVSAMRGEEGKRADAPTEVADSTVGGGRSAEKGNGVVTGTPLASYVTRKTGFKTGGASRAAKGEGSGARTRQGRTAEDESEGMSEESESESESESDSRAEKALW
jgi:hypothetical protein